MERKFSGDFYEVQKRQWQKSLFIFCLLFLFYILFIGLLSLAAAASFGLIFTKPALLSQKFLFKLLLAIFAAAFIIAFFHFMDARKFGANYIIKRLGAQPPDLSDRYHLQFSNTIEEMRIASGLPKVNCYVIPFFAINSMALVEGNGTAAIAVTEGLLSDFTRDEIQAAVAHELAHIIRGDAFYITLVCSLANFFEKIRDALEPERVPPGEPGGQYETRGGSSILIYLAASLSSIVMRLLSMLMSREREILADAGAVELSRNPMALGCALYKAHLKNSFVGEFSETYGPLFIVSPESRDESDGFFSRLFKSHPPLTKRIRLLAQMANRHPKNIIEQVWEQQKARKEARVTLPSFEERMREGHSVPEAEQGESEQKNDKVWAIKDPRGNVKGPLSLEELLFLPFFTSLRLVRNLQEKVEAQANEFPQIRRALRNIRLKRPIVPEQQNRCPRCRAYLSDSYYESVPVKACKACGGKLVEAGSVERIFGRKEVTFSKDLIKKAHEFQENFLLNPIKTQKISPSDTKKLLCPVCGFRMVSRPYNYQYFIPVDKCLSCHKIWFDADELEILQILIEKL